MNDSFKGLASMKSNFELLAGYNQWMNSSLYEAAASLEQSDLVEDRGAFFGSILGTLNHILVGDTIWLKRFSEHEANLPSLDYVRSIKAPASLNTIMYAELTELTRVRAEMDDVIICCMTELTEVDLTKPLSYSSTKGILYNSNFGFLLQHFFNHQTHHRGQISTLFNQLGVDIGVTDLVALIPSE